jgi:hypothetical protein
LNHETTDYDIYFYTYSKFVIISELEKLTGKKTYLIEENDLLEYMRLKKSKISKKVMRFNSTNDDLYHCPFQFKRNHNDFQNIYSNIAITKLRNFPDTKIKFSTSNLDLFMKPIDENFTKHKNRLFNLKLILTNRSLIFLDDSDPFFFIKILITGKKNIKSRC